MNEYLTMLGLALIPAAGNFAGGAAAEFLPVSRRALSFALHAATGLVIAIVSIEIMPRALEIDPAWPMVAAFIAGGLFYIAADATIEKIQARRARSAEGEDGDAEAATGPWMIYFAVSIDLLSDGILIGASATLDVQLALLLAAGQVLADIPEGFATVATLKQQPMSRTKRLLLAAAFVVPVLVGATIGFFAVRGTSEAVKVGLLVFTGGVLTTAVVEEIVPEAHEEEDSRWATLSLIGGFALFMLLSLYLGEGH